MSIIRVAAAIKPVPLTIENGRVSGQWQKRAKQSINALLSLVVIAMPEPELPDVAATTRNMQSIVHMFSNVILNHLCHFITHFSGHLHLSTKNNLI